MLNKLLTALPEWADLLAQHEATQDMDLRAEFARDAGRFDAFSIQMDGLLLDYSKNHIDATTKKLLLKLAEVRGVEKWRSKMFAGEAINNSDDRAVLHTALRDPDCSAEVGGEHVGDFVQGVLAQMQAFSDSVRDGTYVGYTGKAITDVVSIGIGGSDLGPQMVCEALLPFAKSGMRAHFVSNVDARNLLSVLAQVEAETTLFVIASKTFATQETMTNARSAKAWLIDQLGADSVAQHFVAVSSEVESAEAFGILAEHVFPLRPWIGGRYSLWSAIGLPICLLVGYENFAQLLKGARAMDAHFLSAPMEQNIPVMMAMVGIWNWNFKEFKAQAVLPYSYDLRRLPSYIQQLDMESNGKSVTRGGRECDYTTSPVVFGEQGPNGQHAFYQLIHQGTHTIPCDFIGVIAPEHDYTDHHEKLLANLVGQSQALMEGRPDADVPYRYFAGNKPSTTLLIDRLDPYHLGLLLATYEHKVFVQGIIWDINSYDQWGVELGKELASSILSAQDHAQFDGSTSGLLKHIQGQSRS